MLTVIQNISMSLPRPQHKESNDMHVHNTESNTVVLVQKKKELQEKCRRRCATQYNTVHGDIK